MICFIICLVTMYHNSACPNFYCTVYTIRFQHGYEVQNKGVARLSMLDTISTRGATTILDSMELKITKIQIYRLVCSSNIGDILVGVF